MPRYRATEDGFWEAKMYGPERKRKIVVTDKQLKPVPSWLEPIKEESPAEAKKRAQAEAKAAKEQAKKAAEDQKEIDAVTFTEAPSPTQPGVETL